MRAIMFSETLSYEQDYPAPEVTGDECRIRVRMAGICGTDLHITAGYMGYRGVLGHEFVGTVERGPSELTGKRVVGEINCVCGTCDLCQSGLSNHCRNRTVLGILGRDGAFADFVSLPARNLHVVPDSLSDEQAVFSEPVAAALQILAQVRIEKRMRVSVVGPGRLGLLVVQVLKATGCKLDAIGRNPVKLEMCEKLGVQPVHVDELDGRKDRDVVIECSGDPGGLETALSLVRPRGTLVLKSTYPPVGSQSVHDATCTLAAQAGPASGAAGDAESRGSRSAVSRDSRHAALHGSGSTGSPSHFFPDLSPIVIDEITVVGSRCGSFPPALDALAREAIEVRGLISRTYPLERGIEAFEAARDPRNIKVLLKP